MGKFKYKINQIHSIMEDAYFYVQAEIGITKHPGGWKATKELVKLCHIDDTKYVLVVGCGTGISAVKIAKVFGCRVMGVDISPGMIKNAIKQKNIKYKVGDAQKLPFKNNTFDAVISESVTAFPSNKQKAVREYARVLKKDGYVGLNETTWLSKPTKELKEFALKAMGGCKPEFGSGWKKLLENAGLKVVLVEPQKIKAFEQAIGEMQMNGFRSITAFSKMFLYYFTRKEFRKAVHTLVKDAIHLPKGLMKSLGVGIYVGKK